MHKNKILLIFSFFFFILSFTPSVSAADITTIQACNAVQDATCRDACASGEKAIGTCKMGLLVTDKCCQATPVDPALMIDPTCQKSVADGGRGGVCVPPAGIAGGSGCDDSSQIKNGICNKKTALMGLDYSCCVPKPKVAPAAAPTSGTGTGSGLKYTLLENIPGVSTGGASDLPTYLSNIYRLGFIAIGIAALFMVSVGGFMYLTAGANTSQMGSARGVITDALIGLAIALVSYLLLYIINPDLVRGKLTTLTITAPAETPSDQVAQNIANGAMNSKNATFICSINGGGNPSSTDNTKYNDCLKRQTLNPNNAPGGWVNSSDLNAAGLGSGFALSSSASCTSASCTKCSSVTGEPGYAVQKLIDLKQKTGCSGKAFTITGGTEIGHSSHCMGSPTFDFRDYSSGSPGDSCVGMFLKQKLDSLGQSGYSNYLRNELSIDFMCTDPAGPWGSLKMNCSFSEPGIFHVTFCGNVHTGANGPAC